MDLLIVIPIMIIIFEFESLFLLYLTDTYLYGIVCIYIIKANLNNIEKNIDSGMNCTTFLYM